MGWFESQGIEGYAPAATSYRPGATPINQGMGDYGGDPFGYSGGSLLTPWTQQFQAPAGSGGGYSAPEYQKFNYADFGYGFAQPGAFTGQEDLADPGKFQYGDFKGAAPFTGVTEQDMAADPGYQLRVKAGQDALQNSAAARGLLRSGGTAKALVDYTGDAASAEYEKVYGRKASEHDRAQQEAVTGYSTNRGNQAENFDRNFASAKAVNAANNASRLGAYEASSDVALRGGALGYDIAQGTYDRNYSKARQGYDDEQSARNAAASAGSANSNQAYSRAMNEYLMSQSNFRENQDRQYSMLMGTAGMGMQAAGQQGAYGGAYGQNMNDLYTGQGNARAAGQVASGAAWGNAAAGIGSSAIDLYGATRPNAGRWYSGGLTRGDGVNT